MNINYCCFKYYHCWHISSIELTNSNGKMKIVVVMMVILSYGCINTKKKGIFKKGRQDIEKMPTKG